MAFHCCCSAKEFRMIVKFRSRQLIDRSWGLHWQTWQKSPPTNFFQKAPSALTPCHKPLGRFNLKFMFSPFTVERWPYNNKCQRTTHICIWDRLDTIQGTFHSPRTPDERTRRHQIAQKVQMKTSPLVGRGWLRHCWWQWS